MARRLSQSEISRMQGQLITRLVRKVSVGLRTHYDRMSERLRSRRARIEEKLGTNFLRRCSVCKTAAMPILVAVGEIERKQPGFSRGSCATTWPFGFKTAVETPEIVQTNRASSFPLKLSTIQGDCSSWRPSVGNAQARFFNSTIASERIAGRCLSPLPISQRGYSSLLLRAANGFLRQARAERTPTIAVRSACLLRRSLNTPAAARIAAALRATAPEPLADVRFHFRSISRRRPTGS